MAARASELGMSAARVTADDQRRNMFVGSTAQVSSSMGGGVGVVRGVEWSAAAWALATGTAAARATSVEGGGGDVEWSEAARVSSSGTAVARATTDGGSEGRASALGTAAAQVTAAGGSKDSGVRTEAARSAA